MRRFSVLLASVLAATTFALAGGPGSVDAASSDGGNNAVGSGARSLRGDSRDPIADWRLSLAVDAALAVRTQTRSVVPANLVVEILHDDAEDLVRRAVARVDGTVTGTVPGTLVEASVRADRVDEIALADGVTHVRKARRVGILPNGAVSALTGQHVAKMNASAWHGAGFRGNGAKVAVFDYFDRATWNAQLSNGEVPPASGLFCRFEGFDCSPQFWDYENFSVGAVFDVHGNAVAEVVHDIAPQAQIYLVRVGTVSDMTAAIDWLAARGVRIITRSLGDPYDGPGDGTGPLDSVVDYAASKNITWFNAAGNEGEESYWQGTWSDPDNDGWMNFSGNDETLEVSGCIGLYGLRWSNDWYKPTSSRTDYDLEVTYHFSSGNTMVINADDDQQAGAPPLEADGLGCPPGNVDYVSMRIKLYAGGSGTAGDVLEMMTGYGSLEYWQGPGSAGSPVVDSANPAALAVGAIDPPGGGSIASYSSRGPTRDGRMKPDISAPSCLSSSVYSAPDCFNGTSAATPAAAGAAALLIGAKLASSASGLASLVKHYVRDRGASGPDNVYGHGEFTLPSPPTGPVNTSPAVFVPLSPRRLADTRDANFGPLAPGGGPWPAGSILDLTVAGKAGVPSSGASAVAVNVTIVDSGGYGWSQALPTLRAPIDAFSTSNVDAGAQIRPNFAIVPVGEGGKISVSVTTSAHVIVDVLGYFSPSGAASAGRLVALNPKRVLDTRTGPVPSGWSAHKPVAGESVRLAFPTSSGIPSSGVKAVVLNVTATQASADGWVIVYPDGQKLPYASNLNVAAGSTSANTVIVPLGTSRRIAIYTSHGAHIIADVVGYITDGSAPVSTSGRFVPVTPGRLFDSRNSPGVPIASGSARVVQITGASSPAIPAGAAAVSANITVTGTGGFGWVTAWPTGTGQPTVSNLNWTRAGQTIANAAIAKIGSGGAINARVDALDGTSAHVIVDANGYFTP
jgi:hypothetical protein